MICFCLQIVWALGNNKKDVKENPKSFDNWHEIDNTRNDENIWQNPPIKADLF